MNSDVPPTVVAPHMPGSASSSAIPTPVLNYSPGTNGHHGPPKLKKDYRLSWLGELSCLNFKGKKTGGLLTKLVTRIQHSSTDGLMCIGKGEVAELMGVSKRTADRYILELIAFGCIKLVKKGGSLCGQTRDANWYALGDQFNGTPPPARLKNRETPRPVSPVTLVPKARPVSSVTADQCHALHPLTSNNTHTHTKESPSAFTKTNWMAYTENPALFPGWTREDRERCFDLAKRKGYETDETWRGCCAFYFKQWQRHNAKPQAPAAAIAQRHFTPEPRPAVRSSCESPRIGGLAFDGLSKQEWHAKKNDWYGTGGEDNWRKLGEPHLAGMSQAERHSAIAALIAKKGLGVAA